MTSPYSAEQLAAARDFANRATPGSGQQKRPNLHGAGRGLTRGAGTGYNPGRPASYVSSSSNSSHLPSLGNHTVSRPPLTVPRGGGMIPTGSRPYRPPPAGNPWAGRDYSSPLPGQPGDLILPPSTANNHASSAQARLAPALAPASAVGFGASSFTTVDNHQGSTSQIKLESSPTKTPTRIGLSASTLAVKNYQASTAQTTPSPSSGSTGGSGASSSETAPTAMNQIRTSMWNKPTSGYRGRRGARDFSAEAAIAAEARAASSASEHTFEHINLHGTGPPIVNNSTPPYSGASRPRISAAEVIREIANMTGCRELKTSLLLSDLVTDSCSL